MAQTSKLSRSNAKASKKEVTDLVINKQLTQEQAAKLTGVCQQRISQIISEAKANGEIEIFREQKDKILEGLQYQIINNVSSEDIKKANLQSKIWATGVLQDKIQVLRGQATQILDVDIRHLIASISSSGSQQGSEQNDQVIDITTDDISK